MLSDGKNFQIIEVSADFLYSFLGIREENICMGERDLSREFGYRVMRRRMSLGMNQKALAERTGVRQGLISRLLCVDYLLARTDDAGEIPDMPRYTVVG